MILLSKYFSENYNGYRNRNRNDEVSNFVPVTESIMCIKDYLYKKFKICKLSNF